MVEELYFIDADTEEDAIEILYNGEIEPTQYGSMNITDVEIYVEQNDE
jgi:hypothetical protein